MLEKASDVSALAAQVDHSDGVYFVSAFGGLLAPHWRDDARGALLGLTLAHDKRHIARAVLDGIAHQASWEMYGVVRGGHERGDEGKRSDVMRCDGVGWEGKYWKAGEWKRWERRGGEGSG